MRASLYGFDRFANLQADLLHGALPVIKRRGGFTGFAD